MKNIKIRIKKGVESALVDLRCQYGRVAVGHVQDYKSPAKGKFAGHVHGVIRFIEFKGIDEIGRPTTATIEF